MCRPHSVLALVRLAAVAVGVLAARPAPADILYVADAGAGTVSRVTPDGVVSPFISGLNGPTGLAFDAAGNLYVAENGSGTVRRVSHGGAISTFASGLNS